MLAIILKQLKIIKKIDLKFKIKIKNKRAFTILKIIKYKLENLIF